MGKSNRQVALAVSMKTVGTRSVVLEGNRPGLPERPGMIVSIRDHTALAGGYDTLADALPDLGLNAVELHADRDFTVTSLCAGKETRHNVATQVGRQTLGEEIERTGFAVTAFLLATDVNGADPGREVAWVVGMAEAAAALGVPALRVDAAMTGERELALEARQDLFAAALRSVIEQSGGNSVDFGIENHGIQGNDPEFLEGLMARVGSNRLGMTLDTGNFYWAGHPREDVYPILERLAPRTVHTHVKNIAYPADQRDVRRPAGWEYGQFVCPIPEGDIDHARVARILASAGYKRDLCIEDESLDRFDTETRRRHLREAARHLAQCIAEADAG